MTLGELVAALDGLLGPGSEVLAPAARPLRCVALTLDGPVPGGVDAAVVHRAWGVEAPQGVGLVGCHDPFDARLGLAGNAWLHEELGLRASEPLAPKAIVADAPADLAERVRAAFGGQEGLRRGAGAGAGAVAGAGEGGDALRAVLADAMTDALVRAAAAAGARLYVTGSWRVPGARAAQETGIAVQVVGHARTERAALRRLAGLLGPRLPGVELAVYERT